MKRHQFLKRLTILAMVVLLTGSLFAQQKQTQRQVDDPTFKGDLSAAEAYSKANDFYRGNDFENALKQYQTANEKVPGNFKVLYGLALTYKKLNLLDKALYAANDAVQSNPQYDKALNLLGNIYQEKRQFDKAYDAFKKAAVLDTNDYKPVLSMANAAYYGQDYGQAIKDYQKVMAMKLPTSKKDKVYEMMLRSYLETQQYDKVVSTYKDDEKNSRNKYSSLYYGEALYKLGKKSDALVVFEGLAKMNTPGARQWIEKIKKEK